MPPECGPRLSAADAVLVGGVDVRELHPGVLLDEIAVVFQDVYLFDDTIENNLRLAHPEATWDELDEVARATRLDEVVERLPDGWQTRVGEAGAQLSGANVIASRSPEGCSSGRG